MHGFEFMDKYVVPAIILYRAITIGDKNQPFGLIRKQNSGYRNSSLVITFCFFFTRYLVIINVQLPFPSRNPLIVYYNSYLCENVCCSVNTVSFAITLKMSY